MKISSSGLKDEKIIHRNGRAIRIEAMVRNEVQQDPGGPEGTLVLHLLGRRLLNGLVESLDGDVVLESHSV